MNDFISLICPACGGKLQVGKNPSVVICEYCGREHIVRRQDGGVTLESFAQCPKCGRNDRVEKISAILRKENNSTYQSSLGNLLTPPKKPKLLPKPELQETKAVPSNFSTARNIFLVISPFSVFIAIVLLINSGFNSEDLICIIPTLLLIGLTLFFKKKSDEKATEIYKEYKQALEKSKINHQKEIDEVQNYNNGLMKNWRIASDRWEKLYYCNRDDCIFIPGEDDYAKIDEMDKFIFRGLPNPKIDNALKTQILNQTKPIQKQNIPQSQESLTQNRPKQAQYSFQSVINRCPYCGSTHVTSPKRDNMSCIWIIIIFISSGLGLIFWFFTPKYVTCDNCGAKWRV